MAFRASAVGNNGSTGTSASCAITVPTTGTGGTVVAGDVAIVFLVNNLGSTGTFTPPASDGWTLRTGPDSTGNNILSSIYTKTLAAGDIGAVKTFTTSTAGHFLGVMQVRSGIIEAPSVLPAFGQTTTAAATVATPSVTTTAANSDVVQFLALRGASTTAPVSTTPASFSSGGASLNGTVTAGAAISAATFYLTTPGAVGTYGSESVSESPNATATTYTIAFAPANVFTGSLAVTGTGTTSFTATSHMQSGAFPGAGSGSLTLGGKPATSGAMAVAGSGSLTMSGAAGLGGPLSVAGSGALTLAGTPRPLGALAVTGDGALVFASNTGQGALAVTGVGTTAFVATALTASGLLAVTGVGALGLTGKPAWGGALAVAGSGALVISGKAGSAGALARSGAGALAFTFSFIVFFRYQSWNGSAWVKFTPQVWDGFSWVAIPVTVTAASDS